MNYKNGQKMDKTSNNTTGISGKIKYSVYIQLKSVLKKPFQAFFGQREFFRLFKQLVFSVQTEKQQFESDLTAHKKVSSTDSINTEAPPRCAVYEHDALSKMAISHIKVSNIEGWLKNTVVTDCKACVFMMFLLPTVVLFIKQHMHTKHVAAGSRTS